MINIPYIYNKVKSMASKAVLFLSWCLLLGTCGMMSSCDAENTISTEYPCHFIFYTQYHVGSSIETALLNQGSYSMVSAGKVNNAWRIYSTLNDGKNKIETIALTTAKENYASYSAIGAGNDTKDATKNGFILGCTNFQGRVAWDRQCPNCIRQYGGRNYPLEWTGNRQSVICNKCKRTYALETGAITSGGLSKEDKPLMRYQVSYGGCRHDSDGGKLKRKEAYAQNIRPFILKYVN